MSVVLGVMAPALCAQEVPFVPSPTYVVDRMLQLVDVSSDDVVYDLGCGDGRIVVAAAKKYGARGVGIDIDPNRIKEANAAAERAGVTDKTQFICRDVFESRFSDATVVYLYMLPSFNIKLRPRLLTELRPGTRIAAYTFGIGDWKPDITETTKLGAYAIYVWIVPASVAGVWDCQLQTPQGLHHAVLRLSQKYQQVAGSVLIDNITYPLTDAKLRGEWLTFSLPLPGSLKATQFHLNMSNHPTPKPATRPSTPRIPQ